MRTTLSDLIPVATPELPGCPPNAIVAALRLAARRFCVQTECWQKTLDPIDTVASQLDYVLDPDESSGDEPEVRRIKSVDISGVTWDTNNYDLVFDDTLTTPSFIIRFVDGKEPNVSASDAMVVKVVLAPDGESDTVSTDVVLKWQDGIVAGALWDLLLVPARLWYNPDRAQFWRLRLDEAISAAIREKDAQHKTRYPRAYNPEGWL